VVVALVTFALKFPKALSWHVLCAGWVSVTRAARRVCAHGAVAPALYEAALFFRVAAGSWQ